MRVDDSPQRAVAPLPAAAIAARFAVAAERRPLEDVARPLSAAP